ncbi:MULTISPECIES: outer membrane beta-barrel family protein [unclassified Mucilaginibacter]|uniref:outer membrane beta-barrel family protein n=1 Tax=unclassified Mucilaginibacter TaxID=2617802 RepID=UPI00339A169D
MSPAQSLSSGKITGFIVDSLSATPIPSATVGIYRTGDMRLIAGANTAIAGTFVIANLPAGSFRAVVSILGYNSKTIELINLTENATVSLGTIRLKAVNTTLSEVTIVAKLPVIETRIDKLIYNAAADVTSQGGTALDALKKAPMVAVDIDGNVELQGNGNIRFLINGKPSTVLGKSITDALQGIPASDIKNIEIITSPGAKYDAAGTAGIINIVMKENKLRGVGGSINTSAGTRIETIAANVGARWKNVGVNAFVNGTYKPSAAVINTSDRHSFNPSKDTITEFFQQRRSPIRRDSYNIGLSFDWSPSPKNLFTGSISQSKFSFHGTGITPGFEHTYLSSGALLSTILSTRYTTGVSIQKTVDVNLSYKRKFVKDGHELEFSYTSSSGTPYDYSAQLTTYPDGQLSALGLTAIVPGRNKEQDIALDYSLPISSGYSLETGVKAELENIFSKVTTDSLSKAGTYVTDAGATYRFNFRRNIYAAYFSGSFSLFKDFINGKAGLRYETTYNSSDFAGPAIPKDQILAPSVLIQHKIREGQSMILSYTYRIERPDYEDLNPFVNIIDPHNLSEGNPLLKTEKGHQYKLAFNDAIGNSANLSVSVYYNYNKDDLQPFITYYPTIIVNGNNYTGVSLSKPENIGSQVAYGANANGSWSIGRLDLRSDLMIRYLSNRVQGFADVNGVSYRLNLNADYSFGTNWIAEGFINYDSKRTNFQNTRPEFLVYTFALKKQLFSKKANIGITATDPFNKYTHQQSSAYGSNFYQTVFRQEPNRSFGIFLSYKFGNTTIKKETGTKVANE